MKNIGVITGTRADYGIYRPVLRAIGKNATLNLHLMVCGAHLSPIFGNSIDEIKHDGFAIAEQLETLDQSDSPSGITRSMANGMQLFGEAFEHFVPDILLVLGDRYEMFAAAAATLPFAIPIAHIHGGELTEGVIDEAIRHSLTKMSHLHFVSTEEYRRRVIQMGERPECVIVSGAPSLDELENMPLMSMADLAIDLDITLDQPPILVTFHPVTLEHFDTANHIDELLKSLSTIDCPIIFTYPNADTGRSLIIDAISQFQKEFQNVRSFHNLGKRRYFSLMAISRAMVGNSSSGIVEAASFKLPVVNIGSRQKGRTRSLNVIDVGYSEMEIRQGLDRTASPEFLRTVRNLKNIYGDGNAAARIVETLSKINLSDDLIKKPFYDISFDL